jgi:hypothetical protein
MLLTCSNEHTSGCFKLIYGTQLQIDCDKNNWLHLGFSILGVSEHLDKIGDAGF